MIVDVAEAHKQINQRTNNLAQDNHEVSSPGASTALRSGDRNLADDVRQFIQERAKCEGGAGGRRLFFALALSRRVSTEAADRASRAALSRDD